MRNCKTGSFDFKTPSNTLNAYTWPLKKYAVLELLIEFAYSALSILVSKNSCEHN